MRFGPRVFETTDTEGTGAYALLGVASGHQTFLAGILGGAGTLVAYVVTDGTNWEEGYGTLSSGPATLTREAVFGSSNTGALVNWGPGTKNIYCAPSATVLTSLVKGHKGSARPAWLPAGGCWTYDGATPWIRYFFDGSNDVALYRIDPTDNRAVFEGVKATDIASAGSIDIGAATGDFVHITGTTTITALGTANQGTERTLVFDGALTLTHNATSLILFDGVNIVTAAGMVVRVRSEGAGNWRQVGGYRAITPAVLPAATTDAQGAVELATAAETLALADTARAVTPASLALLGAPTLLDTLVTTSGSTVTSSTLPACRELRLVLNNVSLTGTGTVRLNVSADDGANWSGDVNLDQGPSSGYQRGAHITIYGTGVVGNKIVTGPYGNGNGVGDAGFVTAIISSVTGVINKLRLTTSAGSFDLGAAYILGVR